MVRKIEINVCAPDIDLVRRKPCCQYFVPVRMQVQREIADSREFWISVPNPRLCIAYAVPNTDGAIHPCEIEITVIGMRLHKCDLTVSVARFPLKRLWHFRKFHIG